MRRARISWRSGFRAAVCAASVLATAHEVRADTLGVDLRAPAECPNVLALAARVNAASSTMIIPQTGAQATLVTIEHLDQSWTASIRTPSGGTREFRDAGATCDAIFDATALAIAMYADAIPRNEEEKKEPAPRAVETVPWVVRMKLEGLAALLQTRPVAGGAMFGVSIERGAFAIAARGQLVPASRLSLGSGSVSVSAVGGSGAVCLAPVQEPIRLNACAAIKAMAMNAEASGFATNESQTKVWFGAGPEVNAAIPMAGPLHLTSAITSYLAFERQQFGVQGAGVAYESPQLGIDASLGVGLAF